jgi:hypothetical protein
VHSLHASLYKRSRSLADESIGRDTLSLKQQIYEQMINKFGRRSSEHFDGAQFFSNQLRLRRQRRIGPAAFNVVGGGVGTTARRVRMPLAPPASFQSLPSSDVDRSPSPEDANMEEEEEEEQMKLQQQKVEHWQTGFRVQHRRCRSQGNYGSSPPKADATATAVATSMEQNSNESLSSLFYPFTDQFESLSFLRPPTVTTTTAQPLSSSPTSPSTPSFANRTCVSLNSSPWESRCPSGSSTPVLPSQQGGGCLGRPIRNPTSSLQIPTMKTLSVAVAGMPSKMETILLDRPPSQMSDLSPNCLFLNGFSLTLDELDELYQVG